MKPFVARIGRSISFPPPRRGWGWTVYKDFSQRYGAQTFVKVDLITGGTREPIQLSYVLEINPNPSREEIACALIQGMRKIRAHREPHG